MVVRWGLRQFQQRTAVGGLRFDTCGALTYPVSEEALRARLFNQRAGASAFGLLSGGLCG